MMMNTMRALYPLGKTMLSVISSVVVPEALNACTVIARDGRPSFSAPRFPGKFTSTETFILRDLRHGDCFDEKPTRSNCDKVRVCPTSPAIQSPSVRRKR